MLKCGHIRSSLPSKCAIKLCACSSMLGLLCQLPFLDGSSHQTSYPMKVDAVFLLLLFFVFIWHQSHKFFLFENLFDKCIDRKLEIFFPPMQRELWKSAFQLLEVPLSIFFPLNHACSVSGIHGSRMHNNRTCVSP